MPHEADLLGRPDTPSDGRWQRGEIVPALYLADTAQTATAEWYRSLAEWGLSPQDHVPYDHHRWRVDLQLADLGDVDPLQGLALDPPRPGRHTWTAYQRVGERLWREGWAGLIAPSAARPGSLIACVFAPVWPPAGCTPSDASAVNSALSGWWFEPIPGHTGPQDSAQPSQCRIPAVDVVSSQIRPIEVS